MFWKLYNMCYNKIFGKRVLVQVLDEEGNIFFHTWGRER